ncbi:MAG: phosphate ABC transporter permease subunit PstC [Dehalococcoidales bacterium]|nr:phosphate ABC transporter permease subunit PstC [Dehalococcoidales bacterium]MDZ4230904.1 phosphate ABC transporter permease subunit PstC [Dehalococcoidales bacterium]
MEAAISRTERRKGVRDLESGRRTRSGDSIFSNLTLFFALVVVGILVGMVIALNIDAMPAIRKFGAEFLFNQSWNPVTEQFGALPAIYGTLLSSAIGLLIAVPISLGAAIFLVELSPSWIRGLGSFLIEMLAAIPSVIIGLWGLFVLVPFVRNPIEKWLGANLGFLPFFQGPPFGLGFLAAGIILAIMVLPIITAMSRDVIRAVPANQREAMLALGATRWEMIRRAVLPYCRSGLVGAVILGLGRALGETMAVTMVIGNSYALTASLFSPGATIASKIAGEFSEATGDIFIGSLVELALVLFAVTLVVNVVARLLVWRMTAVKGAKL